MESVEGVPSEGTELMALGYRGSSAVVLARALSTTLLTSQAVGANTWQHQAMRWRVVERICLSNPDKSYCEDLCAQTGGLTWLLDGATPVGKARRHKESDALWLVETFDRLVREEKVKGHAGLRELLEGVCLRMEPELAGVNWEEGEGPVASMEMAWLHEGTIEHVHFGDTVACLESKEGSFEAEPIDQRLAELDAETATQTRLARANGEVVDVTKWRGRIHEQRKRFANQPDGYSIFTGERACLKRGRWTKVEAFEKQHVLLYSDGFTRVLDFGVASHVREFCQGGLMEAALRLRAAEREDARGEKVARLKQFDDVSALLLQVE